MPIAKIEFNLEEPSDREAFQKACKAEDMALAIFRIRQEIFRPARKHGYPDKTLNDMINNSPVVQTEYGESNLGTEMVSMLERLFSEILDSCGVGRYGGIMLTIDSFLKGIKLSALTKQEQNNLQILADRLNNLFKHWKKPVVVTSGFRTMQDHIRVYAQKGITDKSKIPMKSKHLSGEAADIHDPDGSLYKWCKANENLLQECQLWCEDDPSVARQHFQIVPPASGRRWFKP